MKITFKKAIAVFMATASLTTGMVGMSANASYHDDKLTRFVVSGYYEHNTPTREKDDDTSASIMITETDPAGCKMVVRVYGTYTSSSSPSGGVNQTAGTPKIVGTASYYTYLPNYVDENMRRDSSGRYHDHVYAYLGLRTSSTSNGKPEFYASGYWSPDSI